MWKILLICVLWTTVHSETIEWFNGRWLPIVLYSNTIANKSEEWIGWHGDGYIGLWTGWLLQSKYEPKECGWLEFFHNTSHQCTCGERHDIPLVQITDLAKLDTLQFYKFNYNESRPVIVVDSVDEVEAALSANCTCGADDKTQLVFRKTSNDYLVSYENREQTRTGPNMTLVMVRYVPTMSELQLVTHSPSRLWDIPYQSATLMCDPTFFDDSAYVVGSDDDNSPFLTLSDLKNDNEPRNDDESLTEANDDESTQGSWLSDIGSSTTAGYNFESTTRVEDDKMKSSTQATNNVGLVAESSVALWAFNIIQIAGKAWLENRIE